MRAACSHYVLMGTAAGFGLLVISAVAQLLVGGLPAAAVGIGVIAAVPADQVAPRRGKLRQLLPSVLVGLPLFYFVQRLSDDPLDLGLLIVPASFLAFLGAAWGKRGIPLSVSAMLSIILSIAVPAREAGGAAFQTSLWFAAGMIAYIVYATLANLALNARYRVTMLADVLLSVAALMRTQARQFAPLATTRAEGDAAIVDPVGRVMRQQAALADQLQAARDILLESPRTPRRRQLAGMLMRVLDLRDHLLACELDVDALVAHPGHTPVMTSLRRTLQDLAREVERLADSLLTGRHPVPFASHREQLAHLDWVADETQADDAGASSRAMLARGLADRVGHIDDETLRLIALARGEASPDLAVVRASWQMFVSPTTWSLKPILALWRWDAPPLRHALRAALAIATGYAISVALPWGEHPYWILLTITVVLRGSLAQTLERRNSRVVGTLLGSLLAGALISLDHGLVGLVLIVAVAQGVAHAFAIKRYLVTAIAATILALTQAHALDLGVSPTFEGVRADRRHGDRRRGGLGVQLRAAVVGADADPDPRPAHARVARAPRAAGPRPRSVAGGGQRARTRMASRPPRGLRQPVGTGPGDAAVARRAARGPSAARSARAPAHAQLSAAGAVDRGEDDAADAPRSLGPAAAGGAAVADGGRHRREPDRHRQRFPDQRGRDAGRGRAARAARPVRARPRAVAAAPPEARGRSRRRGARRCGPRAAEAPPLTGLLGPAQRNGSSLPSRSSSATSWARSSAPEPQGDAPVVRAHAAACLGESGTTVRRQREPPRSRVGAVRFADHPSGCLQDMDDLDDARTRDAEHPAERRLRDAVVRRDHDERGETLQRDAGRSERRFEVLVDRDLGAPDRIADEIVEDRVADARNAAFEVFRDGRVARHAGKVVVGLTNPDRSLEDGYAS